MARTPARVPDVDQQPPPDAHAPREDPDAPECCAVCRKPLWVLDEPLVGLDAQATATTRASRAANDGYTLITGHMGTHAASVPLYPNLAYHPEKSFEPVGLLAGTLLPQPLAFRLTARPPAPALMPRPPMRSMARGKAPR